MVKKTAATATTAAKLVPFKKPSLIRVFKAGGACRVTKKAPEMLAAAVTERLEEIIKRWVAVATSTQQRRRMLNTNMLMPHIETLLGQGIAKLVAITQSTTAPAATIKRKKVVKKEKEEEATATS